MTESVYKKYNIFANIFSRRLESILSSKYFVISVFVFFALQAGYYAVKMAPFISPDEIWHYMFIQNIASDPTFPFRNNEATLIQYGLDFTAKLDFLYHYLLGLITALTRPFIDQSFYILRFINIGFAITGLIFVYKTSVKITESKPYSIFPVIFMGQLLMFGMLSASINYDNLAFMLVWILIFKYSQFREQPSTTLLLIIASISGLILLTKISATVIAIVVCVLSLIKYVEFVRTKQNKTGFDKVIVKEIKGLGKTRNSKVVALVFLITTAIVFSLYASSQMRYGTPKPSCTNRHSIEVCEKYDWFYRREQLNVSTRKPYDGDVGKFFDKWTEAMSTGIFGFIGDERIIRHPRVDSMVAIFLVLSVVSLIRRVNIRALKRLLPYIVMATTYLYLLINQNFSTYVKMGGLAGVQGRYVFFILPIVLIICLFFIKDLLKSRSQYLIIVFLLLLSLAMVKTSVLWFDVKTSSDRSIIIEKENWTSVYDL